MADATVIELHPRIVYLYGERLAAEILDTLHPTR